MKIKIVRTIIITKQNTYYFGISQKDLTHLV